MAPRGGHGEVQLVPCLGVRSSLLFLSDLEMFQPEAMLLLLILAVLGTPAFSADGKPTVGWAPLPGGHLISLNPGDPGLFPAFATD